MMEPKSVVAWTEEATMKLGQMQERMLPCALQQQLSHDGFAAQDTCRLLLRGALRGIMSCGQGRWMAAVLPNQKWIF